jgi:hypothetical protein
MEEPEIYDPEYDDDPALDDNPLKCPKCHGRGRAMEGWPCEYCDGLGYLEF